MNKENNEQTTENLNEPVVTYPTVPDENGWFYETEEEEKVKINTKEHENGNYVKRLYIKRGKVEVILRQLQAKESKQTAAMAGFVDGKKGDNQDLQFATIHLAATFNGEKLTMEEISCLHLKDFAKIMMAFESLNLNF